MYPNQGQPPFGAGYNPYNQGSAPPFGAGGYAMPQPQQQQPFGGGYPMPQPGMPQPGMPQPGMHQPQGMPMPGMPQQPFNYQSPPTSQFGFPAQPPMPTQQPYGQAPSAYPQMPTATYGMGPDPVMQQSYQSPSFGAPPPQQHQPPYGAPPHQPYQQVPFGAPNTQSYGSPSHHPAHQVQSQRKGRPTVVAAGNFNASNDAGALRKAMKGFGTDENAIIEVLCRRTNAQRMDIVRTYKTAYGKDLIDDIRSETSGNFERILVALLTQSSELYARELFEAMYGEGTDEDVLIEVMCTMTNYEIREISAMFQRMFGKNLENELRSDTSGTFKRLMTSLSCGNRDESMATDVNQARLDAQELKRAGVDKWGTDESTFNRILCLRNYEQIKLITQEYEKLTGNSLEKDIKREFSGDIEDGLLAILRVAHNRPEFFARRLHKAMAGIGTNDKSLVRLVVSRSEIDMMDIKDEFQRYYGKTLKSFIKGDTSGHYKHALYALIGENRS